MDDELLERVYRFDGRAQIEVSNLSGTVVVRGADRRDIRIRARRPARGAAGAATLIDIGQEGNRVWARTRLDRYAVAWLGWIEGGERPADVSYDVECPYHADVSVNGVNSSLDVRQIVGAVATNAVTGDSTVANVTGNLTMNSVSGRIAAEQVTGDLKLKTVSGQIEATNCWTDDVRANAVSGTIGLESHCPLRSGAAITTVSGDCDLAIPATTACTIVTHSVSGSVRCDLPADVLESKRTRWRAHVNGGGPQVTFNSVSGRLAIRAASPASAAPRADALFVEQEPTADHPGEPEAPPSVGHAGDQEAPSSGVSAGVRADATAEQEPAHADFSRDADIAAETDATNGATTEPQTAPDEPAADRSAATMRLLKAIERGELSVDEGLRQLDALDRVQEGRNSDA